MVKLKDRVVKGASAVCTHTAFILDRFVLSLFEAFLGILIVTLFAIRVSPILSFSEVELFFRFVYLTSRATHGVSLVMPL